MKTTTTLKSDPTPACHAIHSSSHESVAGIMFEKTDETWCFLPYALLSAVELISKEELTFHFASGAVTVHGRNLELLAKPVQRCLLERIWETQTPREPDRVWVRELHFPRLSTETESGSSPFPTES